jgi:hypothetical protein
MKTILATARRAGVGSGVVLAALLAVIAGQGCHGQCGTIHAADYDQSCSVASDCVAEPEGDFCGANKCTDCANAVISVKAQARYEADLASKISTPFVCPCPPQRPVACDHGRCGFASLGGRPDGSAGN